MGKAVTHGQRSFQLTRKQLAQFVNAVQDFLELKEAKGGVIVEAEFGTLVTNIHYWMAANPRWEGLLQEIRRIVGDWRRAFKIQRDAITRAVNKLRGLRKISFSTQTQAQERRRQPRAMAHRSRYDGPYRRPKYRSA